GFSSPLWLNSGHKKFMNPNKVLWIYIILLIIGGLIGFLKAKSKVSLIMSAAFAAALSLCAADIIFKNYVADILMALLLMVFAVSRCFLLYLGPASRSDRDRYGEGGLAAVLRSGASC